MASKYVLVSGIIFGVVAIIHAVRATYGWPVHVADIDVPTWISWIAMVISGGLCAWAFGSDHKRS